MTAPPGLVAGSAVVLTGEALETAARLLSWALRDHRQRGLVLPPGATEIVTATLEVCRDQQRRHCDVAPAPVGAEWLTTAETAKRLGVGVRHAQRLAKTLEAQRYRNQLRFPRALVDEYRDRRPR